MCTVSVPPECAWICLAKYVASGLIGSVAWISIVCGRAGGPLPALFGVEPPEPPHPARRAAAASDVMKGRLDIGRSSVREAHSTLGDAPVSPGRAPIILPVAGAGQPLLRRSDDG